MSLENRSNSKGEMMAINTRSHLKNLYRTPMESKKRRKFLRLDMNENPDGLPNDFIQNILSEIEGDYLSSYPEYYQLTQKLAEYNQLAFENICLSNGSDAAIKYIFDCFISPKDKILLTEPTFAMYPVYCKMFDAHNLSVSYNDDFSFPTETFINNITSDIRLAVLVNPNNPTGSFISPNDMGRIIQKAYEENVLLIIDEAYFYFYDYTAIDKIKWFDNLIVLRTFSKLCGLAALRLGYIAADSTIITNVNRVKPTFDVNGIAVFVATKLLENKNIIKKQIDALQEGKNYIIDRLTESGIDFRSGNANFVLINCKGQIDNIIQSLEKQKILVSGKFKQSFLKDYIRVTIAGKKKMEYFWNVFEVIL